MSAGDKAVGLFCLFIAGWLGGYERRDAQARDERPHCSARLEDGRALATTYLNTAGRVVCNYPPARTTSLHPHGGSK